MPHFVCQRHHGPDLAYKLWVWHPCLKGSVILSPVHQCSFFSDSGGSELFHLWGLEIYLNSRGIQNLFRLLPFIVAVLHWACSFVWVSCWQLLPVLMPPLFFNLTNVHLLSAVEDVWPFCCSNPLSFIKFAIAASIEVILWIKYGFWRPTSLCR